LKAREQEKARQRLISAGMLRPGCRKGTAALLDRAPIVLGAARLSEALAEDRDDRL